MSGGICLYVHQKEVCRLFDDCDLNGRVDRSTPCAAAIGEICISEHQFVSFTNRELKDSSTPASSNDVCELTSKCAVVLELKFVCGGERDEGR